MRELGHVCLRCRVRLVAASVSLSQPSRHTTTPAAIRTSRFSTSTGSSAAGIQRQDGTRHRFAVPPRARARASPRDGASSLAIFQSIVNHKKPELSDAPSTKADDIALVRDVAELRTMLGKKGTDMVDAFNFFTNTVLPQIKAAQGAVPPIVLEQLRSVFFTRLMQEKAKDIPSARLPSVSRITEIMLELEILPPGWATLVLQLIQHICQQSTSPTDYGSIEEYETAMARRDAFLHDLIGAWKLFSDQTGKDLERKEPVPASPPARTKSHHRLSFEDRFALLFPQYPPKALFRPSWAAFATSVLLADPFNISRRSNREDALPFIKLIKQLPQPKKIDDMFMHHPDIAKYIESRMGQYSPSFRKVPLAVDAQKGLANIIHRKVRQAIMRRNLDALKEAWREYWGDAETPDAARIQQLKKMPDLFDYFILACMGLRRIEMALDIWESMVRVGIHPTIKTWNSMLLGCKNAKNPEAIETVWRKLVTSGVQLDMPIWTARISGLVMCGDIEGGLKALREMAQIWRDRDELGNALLAVKPSMEPVNAALAGLVRFEKLSAARTLLGWAAKQGIDPDIYTFNTLMRPLVRQGRTDEIHALFDLMKSLDIAPDAATFTIMLDAALADVSTQHPEQQVEVVTRIMNDMQVKANMEAYAKMIYVLLRDSDRTDDAVKAVLAQIWGRGLELSSHIYTILAEHYFSRSPPDADAVAALIENRHLHLNPNIDRVFWERVIKGYCQAGETDRAMSVFTRIFKSGSVITFSTLYDLLLTLIQTQSMAMAAELVASARNIREVEEHGVREGNKRFWKHRFWYLADAYGLLENGQLAGFRSGVSGVSGEPLLDSASGGAEVRSTMESSTINEESKVDNEL